MEISQELREKLEKYVEEFEKDSNLDTLKEMKAILNKSFGEEYNQIVRPTPGDIINHISYGFNSRTRAFTYLANLDEKELRAKSNAILKYKVIIHVPEVEITNGNASHKIKDIYVRFHVRKDGTLTGMLEGCRESLTEAEFMTKYLHSHLPSLDVNNLKFNGFCTGSGEINMVMAKLGTKFTIPNFMMFCLHIKNYLAWESKEGYPYMHLESISKRSQNNNHMNTIGRQISANIASHLIEMMKESIPAQKVFEFFKFEIKDTLVKLEFTEKLELWIANQIKNAPPSTPLNQYITQVMLRGTHLLRIKDTFGIYHGVPDGEISVIPTTPIFQFKGRDIVLKIIDKTEKEKTDVKTYANPEISQAVCEKLSHILTRAAINNDRVRKGITIESKSEAPIPNPVPVQGDLDPGMVGNALL